MARTNYDLGQEIEDLLADFCAANDGTPKVRVIRRAVAHYIDHRTANDQELAKRMRDAKERRLPPRREKISLISSRDGEE